MPDQTNRNLNLAYLLPVIIIANATCMLSGIIEPDGALYAYIAKQMAQHNNFIYLYNNGDWLDKPHFPFWITAFSFKVFGLTSFAYKLPAFCFWLTGLLYLYKIGKAIYSKQTAIVSVLIYSTSFQAVIGLFDVRAEHYLTALTIGALYYSYKIYTTGKFRYIILAAVFSSCAVMTKGIFFLITIASGPALIIIISKEWNQLYNYRWYLYLLLTGIFILPELFCLYTQFDLHPEKVVYGQTNVSGIKFFFWDSQFGRFFNTGPIKGNGDPFFFFHTVIWAFLPWSILLYTAIAKLAITKKAVRNKAQYLILGSALVTFVIFSLSKFQLPHYLIVLFPHFSLISANYITNNHNNKVKRAFAITQRLLLIIGLVAIIAVSSIYSLPAYGFIFIIAIFLAALFLYMNKENTVYSIITLGVGFSIIICPFLNLFFYPSLLSYESGLEAGKWFNKHIKADSVGILKTDNLSFKFYANAKCALKDKIEQNSTSPVYYFTTKEVADTILKNGSNAEILQSFPDFHISKITGTFLNVNTRAEVLDTTVLLKLPSLQNNNSKLTVE